MLTPSGIGLIYGSLRDLLQGGSIAVSDGNQRAFAPIESVEPSAEGVTVVATFGETSANFEWAQREVLSSLGTVVDQATEDQGRKVEGAVWTAQVTVTIQPDEADV